MTREQERNYAASLIREREGYERQLRAAEEEPNEERAKVARSRVEQVDAELKRLGHGAKVPSKRAERR